jgi:dTDP-4-dehydrorhamnose reductase
MLAHDVMAEAPPGGELVALPRAELDITNRAALHRTVIETRPDVVINAAAYTNVDGAEREPDLAQAVNGEAPGLVGAAAREAGALVLHYSTDYVFAGTAGQPLREDGPAAPLGVYGASKLAGERALAESRARYLIIRTQWLFGRHGRSFPRTMWERARSGTATRVVNDQTGRPTYTVDLARATWLLLAAADAGDAAVEGVTHVANGGKATWYDIARRGFEAAGAAALVTPCTTQEYPTPARRPAWSVLDTMRYDRLSGAPLPPWEDAVDRFLDELRAEDT